MKKFENLGKKLGKDDQRKILGGVYDDSKTCSTFCYNCVALSMKCSGDCTPNDHGIWCNGDYHPCPSGNYCS